MLQAPMNPTVLIILLAACALLMLMERMGFPTTLALSFRGDIKRESRWLAQYGQAVSPVVAALLIWQLDPDAKRHTSGAVALLVAVFGSATAGMIIKRLLGRVRPGREHAGRFLGPTWVHANWRESFPSNHTASAVALSSVLAALYPQAAITFWALAVLCAGLRYILDAHWPSDVVGGAALGYAGAWFVMQRMLW